MENKEQIIFSRNTVEFVTVAAEYCAYLERAESLHRIPTEDDLFSIFHEIINLGAKLTKKRY